QQRRNAFAEGLQISQAYRVDHHPAPVDLARHRLGEADGEIRHYSYTSFSQTQNTDSSGTKKLGSWDRVKVIPTAAKSSRLISGKLPVRPIRARRKRTRLPSSWPASFIVSTNTSQNCRPFMKAWIRSVL